MTTKKTTATPSAQPTPSRKKFEKMRPAIMAAQRADHTPGKWHVGDFGLILSETDKIIGQAEGVVKDENAAFICRACNNHDRLLEALKNLVEAGDHQKIVCCDVFVRHCYEQAESAIRAATGEQNQ
ncbi:MAG: hypothetical protein WC364_13265 [Eubacteriales bacterium]